MTPISPAFRRGSAAAAIAALGALVAMGLTPGVRVSAQATRPSADNAAACASLAAVQLDHVAIAAAQWIAPGGFTPPGRGAGAAAESYRHLPAFCRVQVAISPVDGSRIGAEVWLPASWNGRLQAVGNRGWGGSINHALLAEAVAGGYAAASTDTGHEGGGASFGLGHPEAVIDAGHRAVHETTVAAKALIARQYVEPLAHAYWNGCSLGGRQGLSEAQRYPEDFDGIVVGDPANNLIDLYAARLAIARHVHRSATSAIPTEGFAAMHRAALDACDRLDGVTDGVIENPRRCTFEPSAVACRADNPRAGCLSAEQVETAHALYAPVVQPGTDRTLSAAMVPGTELGWSAVAGPQPENNALGLFRFIVLGQPEWDWRDPDFATAVERGQKNWSAALDAVDPDLRRFAARGGKLLLYHGWADPQTPAGNTIAYFRAVRERLGSGADDAVRLFMVPGMGHCEGGAGTDVFDKMAPLVRWVETGEAPERLAASRVVDGAVVRTRPLCRLGSTAVWDGRGSTDEAASFACVRDGADGF